MVIDRLVGVAVASVTLTHLRWHLIDSQPPAATLEAIATAMDRQLPFPSIALQLEGEQLMALDGCRWTFAGSGPKAKVQPKALAEAQGAAGNQPSPLAPNQANREESVSLLNEYYALAAKGAVLSRRSRTPLTLERQAFERERITDRFALVKVFMPAIDKATDANDQLDLEIAGTLAMIAVERAQRTTGQYPATLAQAADGKSLAAMNDPWNPNGPVMYKLLASPDASGRRYLIYSVGVDGADDHGKELESKDRFNAMNKPLTIGADFIVNWPRD
jgi:hypothetical protein